MSFSHNTWEVLLKSGSGEEEVVEFMFKRLNYGFGKPWQILKDPERTVAHELGFLGFLKWMVFDPLSQIVVFQFLLWLIFWAVCGGRLGAISYLGTLKKKEIEVDKNFLQVYEAPGIAAHPSQWDQPVVWLPTNGTLILGR